MADEEVTVRMSLKDDFSGPAKKAEEQAKATARGIKQAGSQTGYLTRTSGAARTLQRDLGSLHQTTLGLSASIGGAFASGLRGGALGLVGMGAAVVGFGVKSLATFQQSQTALDTLTGSVSAGHQLFSQLQQYDLSTAFDFSGITGATQSLLQFGITGQQTLPVLKALGDVAANTTDPSENLQRMAVALGQISTKGKISAEELQQLSEAGLPAYALAASSAHMSVGDLQKHLANNSLQLTPDQLIKGITNYSGPLARYKGAAAKQGDTLAGALSNAPGQVRKTLAETATPFTGEFVSIIKDGTTALTGLISTVGPGIFKLTADIGHLVVEELPKAAPLLNLLVDGLDRLVKAAGPALSGLEPLSGDIGQGITDMFTTLEPMMPQLVTGFIGLVGLLPDMVSLLGDMIGISAPVVGFISDMLKIDGVRQGFAGLLIVLLGYRALSGVAGIITGIAGAVRGLGEAEIFASTASGVPGAGGAGGVAGKVGAGAKAAGKIGILGKIGALGSGLVGILGSGFGMNEDTVPGPKMTDPATGKPIVVGPPKSGASTVLSGLSQEQAVAAANSVQNAYTLNLQPGAVTVTPYNLDPSNATSVGMGISQGITGYVEEKAARR